MKDGWEYHIRLRKAKRIGHRWAVVAYLNGRADPSVPTKGDHWALTLRAACRRAGKEAADKAVANGADPFSAVEFEADARSDARRAEVAEGVRRIINKESEAG